MAAAEEWVRQRPDEDSDVRPLPPHLALWSLRAASGAARCARCNQRLVQRARSRQPIARPVRSRQPERSPPIAEGRPVGVRGA